MPILALLELALLQRRWHKEMDASRRTRPGPRRGPPNGTPDPRELDHAQPADRRGGQFARLVPSGAWAAEASQVSYLWFLDALRAGQGLTQLMAVKGGVLEVKFAGGMHQIAARLAAELGDRVVL